MSSNTTKSAASKTTKSNIYFGIVDDFYKLYYGDITKIPCKVFDKIVDASDFNNFVLQIFDSVKVATTERPMNLFVPFSNLAFIIALLCNFDRNSGSEKKKLLQIDRRTSNLFLKNFMNNHKEFVHIHVYWEAVSASELDTPLLAQLHLVKEMLQFICEEINILIIINNGNPKSNLNIDKFENPHQYDNFALYLLLLQNASNVSNFIFETYEDLTNCDDEEPFLDIGTDDSLSNADWEDPECCSVRIENSKYHLSSLVLSYMLPKYTQRIYLMIRGSTVLYNILKDNFMGQNHKKFQKKVSEIFKNGLDHFKKVKIVNKFVRCRYLLVFWSDDARMMNDIADLDYPLAYFKSKSYVKCLTGVLDLYEKVSSGTNFVGNFQTLSPNKKYSTINTVFSKTNKTTVTDSKKFSIRTLMKKTLRITKSSKSSSSSKKNKTNSQKESKLQNLIKDSASKGFQSSHANDWVVIDKKKEDDLFVGIAVANSKSDDCNKVDAAVFEDIKGDIERKTSALAKLENGGKKEAQKINNKEKNDKNEYLIAKLDRAKGEIVVNDNAVDDEESEAESQNSLCSKNVLENTDSILSKYKSEGMQAEKQNSMTNNKANEKPTSGNKLKLTVSFSIPPISSQRNPMDTFDEQNNETIVSSLEVLKYLPFTGIQKANKVTFDVATEFLNMTKSVKKSLIRAKENEFVEAVRLLNRARSYVEKMIDIVLNEENESNNGVCCTLALQTLKDLHKSNAELKDSDANTSCQNLVKNFVETVKGSISQLESLTTSSIQEFETLQ